MRRRENRGNLTDRTKRSSNLNEAVSEGMIKKLVREKFNIDHQIERESIK